MDPILRRTPSLQIHPSRRCNLTCRHCYSSSGPREATTLAPGVIRDVLDDAVAQGYRRLAISGGEPLMYRGLSEVVQHAHDLGMSTTLTTNGMLLTPVRVEALAPFIEGVAVSVDGKPDSHDHIRGRAGAFEAMRARLSHLRNAGVTFGFIFTLTQHNLHELPWVAEFAVREGASQLQIHPVEAAGRGSTLMPGAAPDEHERAWAFLLMSRLAAQYRGTLSIQLDFVDRMSLATDPSLILADASPSSDALLSDWLDLLVLESDGTMVPLQYGFPRDFALGNIRTARLPGLAERWVEARGEDFRALCREVHAEMLDPDALPFHNWFECIAKAAQSRPHRGHARLPLLRPADSTVHSRVPTRGSPHREPGCVH